MHPELVKLLEGKSLLEMALTLALYDYIRKLPEDELKKRYPEGQEYQLFRDAVAQALRRPESED